MEETFFCHIKLTWRDACLGGRAITHTTTLLCDCLGVCTKTFITFPSGFNSLARMFLVCLSCGEDLDELIKQLFVFVKKSTAFHFFPHFDARCSCPNEGLHAALAHWHALQIGCVIYTLYYNNVAFKSENQTSHNQVQMDAVHHGLEKLPFCRVRARLRL